MTTKTMKSMIRWCALLHDAIPKLTMTDADSIQRVYCFQYPHHIVSFNVYRSRRTCRLFNCFHLWNADDDNDFVYPIYESEFHKFIRFVDNCGSADLSTRDVSTEPGHTNIIDIFTGHSVQTDFDVTKCRQKIYTHLSAALNESICRINNISLILDNVNIKHLHLHFVKILNDKYSDIISAHTNNNSKYILKSSVSAETWELTQTQEYCMESNANNHTIRASYDTQLFHTELILYTKDQSPFEWIIDDNTIFNIYSTQKTFGTRELSIKYKWIQHFDKYYERFREVMVLYGPLMETDIVMDLFYCTSQRKVPTWIECHVDTVRNAATSGIDLDESFINVTSPLVASFHSKHCPSQCTDHVDKLYTGNNIIMHDHSFILHKQHYYDLEGHHLWTIWDNENLKPILKPSVWESELSHVLGDGLPGTESISRDGVVKWLKSILDIVIYTCPIVKRQKLAEMFVIRVCNVLKHFKTGRLVDTRLMLQTYIKINEFANESLIRDRMIEASTVRFAGLPNIQMSLASLAC